MCCDISNYITVVILDSKGENSVCFAGVVDALDQTEWCGTYRPQRRPGFFFKSGD